MAALGFERHEHARCIASSLAAAEAHCRAERVQLTPVRRRVLELLLERHRALGAYDILDTLRNEGLGSQPPVVYRALEFLQRHRFVHKIEKLNAFVACSHPGQSHAPAFLICNACDAVAETQADIAGGGLGDAARAAGFSIERAVVEAEGLCPACRSQATV